MAARDKRHAAAAVAPAGAVIDPQVLNRILEQTSRMDLSEKILDWDTRQHKDNPEALRCAYDKEHGPLQMHGDGRNLLCPGVKNGANCTYNLPVSG
jgi:hypothetical protein